MGGGNIKQDSSYRLVNDINITTWNNKANSNHKHSTNDINIEIFGSNDTISLGNHLKCDIENGFFYFKDKIAASSFGSDSIANGYSVDIILDATTEYGKPHIELNNYTNGKYTGCNKCYFPSESGTLALTDDLNIKGTWENIWIPGFNIYGMGYVFIVPVVNKSTNITISNIQVFTGSGWHDTTLFSSEKKANQLICVCKNSNIDGLEYGKVYLTKVKIKIE